MADISIEFWWNYLRFVVHNSITMIRESQLIGEVEIAVREFSRLLKSAIVETILMAKKATCAGRTRNIKAIPYENFARQLQMAAQTEDNKQPKQPAQMPIAIQAFVAWNLIAAIDKANRARPENNCTML